MLVARAEKFAPVQTEAKVAGITVSITRSTVSLSGKPGTVTIKANDVANSVLRRHSSGGQVLTVLRSGDTATYDIHLPAGSELHPEGFGYAITDASGKILFGRVSPPWAVDAEGQPVPTTYSLSGNTLIQHVDTAGATYPIVADPWISYGWYVYVNFNRSEARWLAQYSDSFQLANVACGAIPNRAFQVGCAASVGWMAVSFSRTVRDAARYSQCVDIKFTYPVGSWPYSYVAGWDRFNC